MTDWTLLGVFMSWKGPFDSLFIENCIAVAQSDLRVPKYKEKVVLIPDNEPRNKQVCKQIEQCIKDGYSVVLYSHSVKEKDINDMILSGYTSAEIQELIHNNTHKDLQAQTVFSSWKRI